MMVRELALAVGEALPPGPAGASPAVADSWLVEDGRARGLALHWERFAASCQALGVAPAALAGLRADVLAALPRSGRWFPRLALLAPGAEAVTLTLRPAPARRAHARAWVHPGGDPRTRPRVKGPDLAALGALRDEAAGHGADEALLLDGSGRILEGAYSSLLWWEGDQLWAVPDDEAVLPGVTRRLVLELAGERGLEPRLRRPHPAELAGREVWLTSALHGIRAGVPGGPETLQVGPPERAAAWQRALEDRARPLG
jgi:branched-subunit amino acid aminotransferase/4-amino-4-deoxychorismate lyase